MKKKAITQKTGCKIFYQDLYGFRKVKNAFLYDNNIKTVDWIELNPEKENYFFTEKDFKSIIDYEKGNKVNDIFKIFTSGVKTHNDNVLISFTKFKTNNQYYNYRPFDKRFIEYDLKKVIRHRYNVMKHMLKDNISFITTRCQEVIHNNFFVSNILSDIRFSSRPGSIGTDYVFPLYCYNENQTDNNDNDFVFKDASKKDNFTKEFRQFIKSKYKGKYTPENILGYIYAILHSPTYRTKYIEFLKIDFPRVPFTDNESLFNELSVIGFELIEHHLLKKSYSNNICRFYGDTENYKVEKVEYDKNEMKVTINKDRYFKPVPNDIWSFYIGGYQVLDKWLKERKKHDIKLSSDDILHFIKVVNVLDNTIKAMTEIDNLTKEWI